MCVHSAVGACEQRGLSVERPFGEETFQRAFALKSREGLLVQVFNRIRLDRIVCTHCLALLHANKASPGASPVLDADGYASGLTMCASVSESFISLNFVYKPFALMFSCHTVTT